MKSIRAGCASKNFCLLPCILRSYSPNILSSFMNFLSLPTLLFLFGSNMLEFSMNFWEEYAYSTTSYSLCFSILISSTSILFPSISLKIFIFPLHFTIIFPKEFLRVSPSYSYVGIVTRLSLKYSTSILAMWDWLRAEQWFSIDKIIGVWLGFSLWNF